MTTSTPHTARSNTSIIAHNSMWYGIEIGFTFVSTFVTSIAMARVLGPEKLGYFNYIMWLANTSGLIGSLGVPATTGKYMAEYLGRGEEGIARAVFFATLRMQVVMATVITAGALVLVFTVGDPVHRTVSAIQVASMLPIMAVFVPSRANAARENLRANVAGSLVSAGIYFSAVVLSLILGWGLLGIALGILASRVLEFIVRFFPVLRWIKSLPEARLPAELKRRMAKFSGQNVMLLLLNVIVWDRSDIIFLKLLCKDISQITFYSVAFNLTEKALVFPQTFGSAIGVTLLAQYGRDQSKISGIVQAAARYMLLFATPLLLGLAALSSPAMRVAYGWQYIAAIPVLTTAALLAVAKPLLGPAENLLQAKERQTFLVWWSCLCGIVNIALDILLIPHYAALGAAIANGVSQMMGVVGICLKARNVIGTDMKFRGLLKIPAAGLLMCLAVVPAALFLRPVLALVIGVPLGAVVFVVSARAMRVLQEEDRARLLQLQRMVPGPLRGVYDRVVDFIARPAKESDREYVL